MTGCPRFRQAAVTPLALLKIEQASNSWRA